MLGWLVVVVLIVGAGIALATIAETSATRWRGLVRELAPGGRFGARALMTSVDGRALSVTTALRPAGMSYTAAARILSRGPILAMSFELGAEANESELRANMSLSGVGPATLKARLEAFVALADALEALPMAEALTRRFVDLPSDTAAHERLAALEAMLKWHPRAVEVLSACRNEVVHGTDPVIVGRARAHLESSTA